MFLGDTGEKLYEIFMLREFFCFNGYLSNLDFGVGGAQSPAR